MFWCFVPYLGIIHNEDISHLLHCDRNINNYFAQLVFYPNQYEEILYNVAYDNCDIWQLLNLCLVVITSEYFLLLSFKVCGKYCLNTSHLSCTTSLVSAWHTVHLYRSLILNVRRFSKTSIKEIWSNCP